MTGCLYFSTKAAKASRSPCLTRNIKAASGSQPSDIKAQIYQTPTSGQGCARRKTGNGKVSAVVWSRSRAAMNLARSEQKAIELRKLAESAGGDRLLAVVFPLTPALSLGEREKQWQV